MSYIEFPIITIYLGLIANGVWRILQNRHMIRFYPLHICWIVAITINLFLTNNAAYYKVVKANSVTSWGNVLILFFHLPLVAILFPEIRENERGRFSFIKYAIIEKPVFYFCLIGVTLLSLSLNYYQSGFTNEFIKDVIIKVMLCLGYLVCIKDDKKWINWSMYVLTVCIQFYYLFFR